MSVKFLMLPWGLRSHGGRQEVKRNIRLLAVFAFVVGLGTVSVAPEAGAAFGCVNANQHFFSGMTQPRGTGVTGVRATLVTRSPALCAPNGLASVAWVMLGAQWIPIGNDVWAQAGFGRDANGPLLHFTQYQFTIWGTWLTTWDFANPVVAGSSHIYTSGYNGTCNCIVMGYGIKVLDQTPPGALNIWTNSFAVWSGEVLDFGTDMPGTANNPMAFQGLQTQPNIFVPYSANTVPLAGAGVAAGQGFPRATVGPLFLNSFLVWTN